jgi:fatty-acyl-CoA synthase
MHVRLADAPDYPDQWTLSEELRRFDEHPTGARGRFEFLDETAPPREVTHDEIVAQAQRVASNLWARGVRPGDRVALVIPDNADFIRAFLGAVWAGFVPVPMFPPLGLGGLDAYAERAAGILEASEASVLVTTSRLENLLWSLTSRLDRLEEVVDMGQLAGAPAVTPSLSGVDPGDPVFLQFTSGSTSRPKGVEVTHRSLAANLHAIVRHGLRTDPDTETVASWLPLYHDMGLIGMTIAPLLWEMPVTYMSPIDFVMYPQRWLEAISERRLTSTFAPNFGYALATKRVPEHVVAQLDLSCVRVAGCGAEPIHPKTMAEFVEHFAPAGFPAEAMNPAYGLAEATLAVSFLNPDQRVRTERVCAKTYEEEGVARPAESAGRRGDAQENPREPHEFVCCGTTFPQHRISIVDDDGGELPERHVGEIVFDGPSVCAGYYNRPEETERAFSRAGLRTGDLGYLADGELYVTGRKKDVIIVHGRNIDPQTIEWKLGELEGVRKGNVAAFSVAGEGTEEIVVIAETKEAAPEGLERRIKRQISRTLGLKISTVVLVPKATLPKTSSGKLQRSKARQQYLDGTLGDSVRAADRSIDVTALARYVGRSLVNRLRHFIGRRARRLRGALEQW